MYQQVSHGGGMNAAPTIDPSFELLTENPTTENQHYYSSTRSIYNCHRCEDQSKIIGRYPYCTVCNLASLTATAHTLIFPLAAPYPHMQNYLFEDKHSDPKLTP